MDPREYGNGANGEYMPQGNYPTQGGYGGQPQFDGNYDYNTVTSGNNYGGDMAHPDETVFSGNNGPGAYDDNGYEPQPAYGQGQGYQNMMPGNGYYDPNQNYGQQYGGDQWGGDQGQQYAYDETIENDQMENSTVHSETLATNSVSNMAQTVPMQRLPSNPMQNPMQNHMQSQQQMNSVPFQRQSSQPQHLQRQSSQPQQRSFPPPQQFHSPPQPPAMVHSQSGVSEPQHLSNDLGLRQMSNNELVSHQTMNTMMSHVAMQETAPYKEEDIEIIEDDNGDVVVQHHDSFSNRFRFLANNMLCGQGDIFCPMDENDTINPISQHVYGRLSDKFGNIFEGQFLNGKRDGHGTIFYAITKDRYEGGWVDDKPHGEGKLTRGDGLGEFEGLWENGLLNQVKQGTASVVDQDGNQYEGSFLNWKKHGNGTLTKSSGEVYVGGWVNGARHGFGTINYPDGSRFEGIFDHDQPTSEGQTFDPPGTAQEENYPDYQQQNNITQKRKPDPALIQRPPLQLDKYENMQSSKQNAPGTALMDQTYMSRKSGYGDDPSLDLQNLKFENKNQYHTAKALLTEKQKIENEKLNLEKRKKKTVESILKVEVKQKRSLKAKMKKQQKDLEERQKLQARALEDAKAKQEKALAAEEKKRKQELNKKLKEIERLRIENEKKMDKDKKKQLEEIEGQRRQLLKMEDAQKKALERQAKELEAAQRKFDEKQRKFVITQQQQQDAIERTQAEVKASKSEAAKQIEMDERFRQQQMLIEKNKESRMNFSQQEKQQMLLQKKLEKRMKQDIPIAGITNGINGLFGGGSGSRRITETRNPNPSQEYTTEYAESQQYQETYNNDTKYNNAYNGGDVYGGNAAYNSGSGGGYDATVYESGFTSGYNNSNPNEWDQQGKRILSSFGNSLEDESFEI